MAVVSGRLQLRDWTDKDGNKRRNAEVVVENIYFGDSRRSEAQAAAGADSAQFEAPLTEAEEDEELPF